MLKALLVDDDISVIRCFEKMIEWKKLGYEKVFTAINGSLAYDIAENENIDVIICDLKMPVMGGVELARKLRENNMDTEIILLTAYEDFSAAREGIELKIYDYILKPIVIETVDRLSENLRSIAQKRLTVSWISSFLKDEFDEEIMNAFRTHNMEYFENVLSKLCVLEQTGNANQMFHLAMIKLIGVMCAYLKELDFSESSIKYNREKLIEHTKKASSYPEIIDVIRSKLNSVIDGSKEHNSNVVNKNIVFEIKKYISKNYMKYDFCVGDISKAFHYSPDHINRVFKNGEGITASKYIINLKMEKAKSLLLESTMSVNEVAKAVGYNSISYFISSFKSYYQITPTALREKNRNVRLNENF